MKSFDFDFIDLFGCGLILLGEDFRVVRFNVAANGFFRGAPGLREGAPFHEISGALKDMAAEESCGEAELLEEYMRAFEECTVDYRRFDRNCYRISVKSGFSADNKKLTAIVIADISDISESERFLAGQVKELSDKCGALRSRLELADAMITGRERISLEQKYAESLSRFSATLGRFERTLKDGDTKTGLAELKNLREHLKTLLPANGQSGEQNRTDFAERLKNALTKAAEDSAVNTGEDNNNNIKIVFHHISPLSIPEDALNKNGGEIENITRREQLRQMENDIIEAARESVLLIVLYGASGRIDVSLRANKNGAELNVRSGGPVVQDFERTEQYARIKKTARKIRGRLETDSVNGFGVKLRCAYPKKSSPPIALVALSDPEFSDVVSQALGGGSEPALRCITASPDIDLLKACGEYSPSVLIIEAEKISKKNTLADRAQTVSRRYGLTEVERRIVSMFGQGGGSEEIASSLHYSQGTLRNMLSVIYKKIGVSGKAQLMSFAIFNGFSENFQGERRGNNNAGESDAAAQTKR